MQFRYGIFQAKLIIIFKKKFIYEKSQNLKMTYFDENWLVTIIVRLVEAVVVVESVVVFRRS